MVAPIQPRYNVSPERPQPLVNVCLLLKLVDATSTICSLAHYDPLVVYAILIDKPEPNTIHLGVTIRALLQALLDDSPERDVQGYVRDVGIKDGPLRILVRLCIGA